MRTGDGIALESPRGLCLIPGEARELALRADELAETWDRATYGLGPIAARRAERLRHRLHRVADEYHAIGAELRALQGRA